MKVHALFAALTVFAVALIVYGALAWPQTTTVRIDFNESFCGRGSHLTEYERASWGYSYSCKTNGRKSDGPADDLRP